MKDTPRAHLALLGTALIFGMHYSIAKGLMPDSFTPLQLIFFRLLGGSAIFYLFQRLFVPEKVDKRDLLILALCGLFGFALNQTLFYEGLNLTNPVDASLIHVLNPVLVVIMASLVLGERVTLLKSGGIALGASGAVILVLGGNSLRFDGGHLAGNLLVFSNMVFYALYLVLIKPMTLKYHTSTILKWVSLFGFLFVIPFSVREALAIHPGAIPVSAWLGLAFVIVLCTFVAYLLVNFAVKHVSLSVVSYYNYLQPFIAAALSVSAGQGKVTMAKVAAAILIFSGVYVVNLANRKETASEKMPERQ